MNASEVIKSAYIKIGKLAAEQSLSGADTQTAIEYLNDLMYSISYLGLSYTEVTAGSDEITTEAYAWKWMKNQLALELAPEFGVLESYAAIERMASEGWSAIIVATSRIGPPQLSGNVPRGSGNMSPGNRESKYYSETDSGILTETNQEIIVEDDT